MNKKETQLFYCQKIAQVFEHLSRKDMDPSLAIANFGLANVMLSIFFDLYFSEQDQQKYIERVTTVAGAFGFILSAAGDDREDLAKEFFDEMAKKVLEDDD